MNNSKDYHHDMTMMLAFHDALRRELGHIARVAATRTDDPRRIMATAVGWQMFKSYLQVHHSCEDDLLWPVMEKTLADRDDDLALLAALEAEHAAIDPLLNAIDATLANPASGPERVGDLTDALATTLHAHLRHEEGEGLALIDATVTDEQWQEFGQENAKRIGPEAPIVFPWMLDGLDDVNTEHILSLLPEPVRAIYTNQWLGTYQQLDRWGATAGSSKGASSNLLRIPRGQDRQL
ncbi:MAG: hemerythrin domain-containing protein [Acidimicrobiales bacterium]|jgi:hemerythrin-like domain-containing protein